MIFGFEKSPLGSVANVRINLDVPFTIVTNPFETDISQRVRRLIWVTGMVSPDQSVPFEIVVVIPHVVRRSGRSRGHSVGHSERGSILNSDTMYDPDSLLMKEAQYGGQKTREMYFY